MFKSFSRLILALENVARDWHRISATTTTETKTSATTTTTATTTEF
jgi:hypothetical protein